MQTSKKAIRWGSAAVAVTLAGLLLAPIFSQRNVAAVTHLSGRARILVPGGKWRPVRPNTLVPDNAWIETGPRGKLILAFRGSEVRLGRATRAKIQSFSVMRKPASIYLKRGFSWFKVRKRKFSVSTPTAVASVRGTMFAVAHGAKGSATCVCKGAVDTYAAGGKNRRTVARGFSDSFDRNGKRVRKDFRKYFKGLKVDSSFRAEIRKDKKMGRCVACHRMTNIATDRTPDPTDY